MQNVQTVFAKKRVWQTVNAMLCFVAQGANSFDMHRTKGDLTMRNSWAHVKIAIVVAGIAIAAVPLVWAGGELVESANAANSGNANGGSGLHYTTGGTWYDATDTYASAYSTASTQEQGQMVQTDAWAFDGSTLEASIEGYDVGDEWAWSTELEVDGNAKVWVNSYSGPTSPPSSYYGEARCIVELLDNNGAFWPHFSMHGDELVSIQEESTTTVDVHVVAGASISILDNVEAIDVTYETRNYVETETDRAEVDIRAEAWGEVDSDKRWYMKLIRIDVDPAEVVDEWRFD
jgi:hypothetical protein